MSLITNLHAHNYTAIQVEFLQNTTTAREGTDVKLDIQYLLTPPNVTLQEPIIVTVMVVNGSATGKLQLSFYCMLYCAFEYCCIDSESTVKSLLYHSLQKVMTSL